MKTTKPEWTATNDAGGKLFYFRELGWVDAKDGLVTPDGAPNTYVQPAGATHVWIHCGAVHFLQYHKMAQDYSMLNGDHWLNVGRELSGRIIPINDADIVRTDVPNSVGNQWFEHKGGCAPDEIGSRRVEVQTFDGQSGKGYACHFRWVFNAEFVPRADNVMRWRYA